METGTSRSTKRTCIRSSEILSLRLPADGGGPESADPGRREWARWSRRSTAATGSRAPPTKRTNMACGAGRDLSAMLGTSQRLPRSCYRGYRGHVTAVNMTAATHERGHVSSRGHVTAVNMTAATHEHDSGYRGHVNGLRNTTAVRGVHCLLGKG